MSSSSKKSSSSGGGSGGSGGGSKNARQMQLIRVVNDPKNPGRECYELGQEAVEFLNSKRNLLGFHLTGGVYRSGKSFFNNRVLLQSRDGPFGVGETVQAHTMGLWISDKTIPCKALDGTSYEVVIVDMEGLSAIKASESHDVQLLALGLLLASCFTLNAKNSINEATLVELAKVVEVTKCIQLRPGQEGPATADELAPHLPPFIFLLRDFSLTLADENGEEITASQYLEQSLESDTNFAETSDKNQMRKMLRQLFPKRGCLTLSHPGVEQKKVNRLNSVPNSELPQSFVMEMDRVRKRICEWTEIKRTATGEPINGPMFVKFAETLVAAFNRGDCPVIQNAWAMMSDLQCRQAYESAITTWMKLSVAMGATAQNDTILSDDIRDTREQCFSIFDKMAVGDRATEYRLKLGDGLDVEEKRLRAANVMMVKQALGTLIQSVSRRFGDQDTIDDIQQFVTGIQSDAREKFGDTGEISGALADVLLEMHVWTWIEQAYGSTKTKLLDAQATHGRLQTELTEVQHRMMEKTQLALSTEAELKVLRDSQTELQTKHHDSVDELKKCQESLAEQTQHAKQQEERAVKSEHELLAAVEESSERIASADQAKAEMQVRLEEMEEDVQANQVRSQGLSEELTTAKSRLLELEKEAQQVYDLTQRLSESEDLLESVRDRAEREKAEFEGRVVEIQTSADHLVKTTTNQWRERVTTAEKASKKAIVESEQRIHQVTQLQEELDESRKRMKQQIDDTNQWKLKFDETEATLKAMQQKWESEKGEDRERRLREVSEVREQWETKVRDAEQGKMDAMQTRLNEKMETTRQIKDLESQLSIARTQLQERKRARDVENAPSEMEKRKKIRIELDEKCREVSRVSGEREAMQQALDRQSLEVARVRAQLHAEQKQHSAEQHTLRMEMFRIKMGGNGGGVGGPASGGPAAAAPSPPR